jgi:HEAT repeat protein
MLRHSIHVFVALTLLAASQLLAADAAPAPPSQGCQVSGRLELLAEHLLAINASGATVAVMRETYQDNTIGSADYQTVECNLDGDFAFPTALTPGRWLLRVDAAYIVDPNAKGAQTTRSLVQKYRFDIPENKPDLVLKLPAAWGEPKTVAERVQRALDSERPESTIFMTWSWRDVQVAELVRMEERPQVVAELVRIIGDPNSPPYWAYTACDVLGEMKPVTGAARDGLIDALEGPWKRFALSAFSQMQADLGPVFDRLVPLQDDPDDAVRASLVRAAGELATKSEGEVSAPLDVLIHGLGDRDGPVRQTAADFLGRLGPRAARAVPHLEARLDDEYGPAAAWSACALFRIDGRAEANLDALIGLLAGDDLEARWHAALALGLFEAKAARAVPALVKQLDFDGKPPFTNERASHLYRNKRSALYALKQIDPATAGKYADE